MKTFADVELFRQSREATDFAANWIHAQRTGDLASEWHMNLLAWSSESPFHVLSIVLNLIDSADNDDALSEMVALGPVEWLVEHSPDEFTEVLKEAVSSHPKFALYTLWKRTHSEKWEWMRLRPAKNL